MLLPTSALIGNPALVLNTGGTSGSSSSQTQKSQSTVFIDSEQKFHNEIEKMKQKFQGAQIATEQINSSLATHFVLFITDSFLKSKEHLLPLISRMTDPHFKQRLFPIMMDDTISKGSRCLYIPGQEQEYVEYWRQYLAKLNQNSSEYTEIKSIEENIASLIIVLRGIFMPSLDELLRTDLKSILELIKKRSHLFEEKRFFFLPQSKIYSIIGQEAPISQITALFEEKNVVLLSGEEGIGKTALAIEYAKRSEKYPSGIFWLNGRNIHTLEEDFQKLAIQLGTSKDDAKRELHHQMKDFLLIYDNVPDHTLITTIPSGHSLIVGTNLNKPDITLGSLSSEDAERYIIGQLKVKPEDARCLADILENHPTKLNGAVDYIKVSKLSIQNYVQFYTEDREGLLAKQKQSQQAKEQTASSSDTFPSIRDPSQKTVEMFRRQSVDQLALELKNQAIQIFVSYSWSDVDPIDQLDNFFKSMGIEIIRDKRELRTYGIVKEFMKRVIRVADYTYSFINDKYLKSPNCLFEIVTTMKDPNWKSRVFPIVLSGMVLDDQTISTYQKFWEDEALKLRKTGGSSIEVGLAQEGVRKIRSYLQFVRQMQPKPFSEQLNTQFQESLALMLARQETLEKKGKYMQKIFHLPMGLNKDFTGRNKELGLLEEALKSGQSSTITNTGMGGVGKSQLALKYAYSHEQEYEMIYWVRAQHLDTLKADLRMLGQEMGIAEDFLKDDKVLATMKGILENGKGWLLVFDNAEDPQTLLQILPQKGGHNIVTSRNPNWPKTISIDVFNKEEALNYLQKISGISDQEDEFIGLAEELGYLPLALTQAGAYIRRQGIDVAAYRAEFKKRRQEFLSNKERGYPDSVATAWSISRDEIAKKDPNAIKLLNFCSYLASNKIPANILETWLKNKNKTVSELDFHDALRVLESYSMIDQKVEQKEEIHKKWISIHQLIQAVTRNDCETNEAQEAKETILLGIDVLNEQFKGNIETKEEREAGEVLVEHANALVDHAEVQKMVGEEVGELNLQIGIYLRKTGAYTKAVEIFEKNLTIYVALFGTENRVDVGDWYHELGLTLFDKGDLAGAKAALEKSYKIYIEVLTTENDLHVAHNQNNMGNVLLAQGDLTGAKLEYERALKIKISHYKTEGNNDVAMSYNNLANVLQTQGDLTGAKAIYEKTLEVQKNCLEDENNITIATSYNNLGSVCHYLGDLTTSKVMYKKAIAIYKECLGTKNHPSIALFYHNLGLILRLEGDLDKAKKRHENALKIQFAFYKTEIHPEVARGYNNFGILLMAQDDLPGAKAMEEKALELTIAYYGSENHIDVAVCYDNLGLVLRAQDDLVTAKEMHEKAQEIYSTCLKSENHIKVATSYIMLGAVLKEQDDLDGAKAMFEKALEIQQGCYKTEEHTKVGESYMNLGDILKAKGDLDQSKTMYEKALKIFSGRLGRENPTVASLYKEIGNVLQLKGHLAESKLMYEKSIEIMSAYHKTEKHVDVALCYKNLALVLRSQGNLSEAKAMLEKVLKIEIECLKTENHTRVATSYMYLGNVLKSQDDLKGAKEKLEKALQIEIGRLKTENHTRVAKIYTNLGNVYQDQSDFAGARAMHEKAIKILTDCLRTENHTSVANSYGNLGVVLKGQGKLDEAKAMFQKALEILFRCLKTEHHPDIGTAYHNLGFVLSDQGEIAAAREMYEKALEIQISCHKTEQHINVGRAYSNLGIVLAKQGDITQAKKVCEKGVQILIACLKTENHSEVAESYNSLGMVLYSKEDFKGAKEFYEKTLRIRLAYLRDNEQHIKVAEAYNNIATALSNLGELAQAKSFFEKALKSMTLCFGTENHVNIALIYNNLGSILRSQEKLAESKKMYEKALQLYSHCLNSEKHLGVAQTYANLGIVLMMQNDLSKAKEMCEKGLNIYKECFKTEKNPLVVQCYTSLGQVLKAQGDFEGAKNIYEKVLQIQTTFLGSPNHLSLGINTILLGDVYFSLNQFDKAREQFIKAKQHFQQVKKTEYDAFLDGQIRECNSRNQRAGGVNERTRLLANSETNDTNCCTIL